MAGIPDTPIDRDRLDTLLRGLLDDFDKDLAAILDSPPLLAHYTSIEVIEKIVCHEELWLSNPLFMNDLEELRFGMVEGKRIFEQSSAVARLCGSTQRKGTIVHAFRSYSESFEKEHALDVYVFCLSEHNPEDYDGRLSMWRAYGGQGRGAALVFNASFITKEPESPMLVAKVSYVTQAQRFTWLEQKIEEACNVAGSEAIADDDLYLVAYWIFTIIKLYALKFKHKGFDEEKEWRLIYMPDRDERGMLKDRLGYVLGPRGVEPKLKLKIEPLPIAKPADWTFSSIVERIILGPSAASPLAVAGVKRMLQSLGKPEFCGRVHASTIPLRPEP
jgi:hypothetical protein